MIGVEKVTEKTAGEGLRSLRIALLTILAGVAAGAAATVIVRNRMAHHRKDLFSANTLQRLAALGYLSRRPATVERIMLLRDFVSWESRRLLRNRARAILARMEEEVRSREETAERVG